MYSYVESSKNPITNKYRLFLDTTLKEVEHDVKIGSIAHEGVHIEDYSKMNFIDWLKEEILERVSDDFVISDERKADAETIRRGFGKELLTSMKYFRDLGSPYYETDGYSIEELEKMLKP